VELRDALLEPDPAAERGELLGRRLGLDVDLVLALMAEARVQDPLGPRAIVRQQEQALGIGIEAADGVEAFARGDERDDGRAAALVAGQSSLDELSYRRKGLLIALGIIVLVLAALVMKIRTL